MICEYVSTWFGVDWPYRHGDMAKNINILHAVYGSLPPVTVQIQFSDTVESLNQI